MKKLAIRIVIKIIHRICSKKYIDPYGLGLEDNDVDALRHAFISGVYNIEYNEGLAELLGRLNEFTTFDSQSTSALSENMDLWNNAVGRSYGKKTKTWNDLYLKLMKALKDNELIIDLKDTRKYKGEKSIKRMPKFFVIKIKENKTGANTEFLDVRKKVVMTKTDFIKAIILDMQSESTTLVNFLILPVTNSVLIILDNRVRPVRLIPLNDMKSCENI